MASVADHIFYNNFFNVVKIHSNKIGIFICLYNELPGSSYFAKFLNYIKSNNFIQCIANLLFLFFLFFPFIPNILSQHQHSNVKTFLPSEKLTNKKFPQSSQENLIFLYMDHMKQNFKIFFIFPKPKATLRHAFTLHYGIFHW